jgi:hypothetical protein
MIRSWRVWRATGAGYRSTRRGSAVIAGVAAIAMLASCRRADLWSGAEFRSDGSLQVAAEEPVCGCMTLANRTGNRVFLRSELRGSTSGGATLNPNETRKFQFDWAGPRPDDYYIVEAMDENGDLLNIRDVVRMEARPVDCESPLCIYDTLLLNVAVEEEQ